MTSALKVTQLVKRRGKFRLDGLDLDLPAGRIMGLVGSNASGKSTLFQCILGLLRKDSGSIQVFGEEISHTSYRWKSNVGVMMPEQGFIGQASVEKNLRAIARFYPSWDPDYCEKVLRRVDLDPTTIVNHLSTGERAKLCLVAAVSHRPKLLLLDEPTIGMDPVVRREFISIVSEVLRSEDHAVLMSTHILSDVYNLADNIAILKDGRIAQDYLKDELLDSWSRISFQSDQNIQSLEGSVKIEREGNIYRITSQNAEGTQSALKQAGITLFESNRIDLEEITSHLLSKN